MSGIPGGEAAHLHIGGIMGPSIQLGPMPGDYGPMPGDEEEYFMDDYIPPESQAAVTASSLSFTGTAGSTHVGGADSDQFTAGPGKSTFTGGASADQMKFTTFNTGAEDTFLDFTSGTDKIKFTASVYTGFSGNTLGSPINANQLYQHTGVDADAADGGKIAAAGFGATGRVAYDPDSGKLYYDEDGSATTEVSTLIAILGDAGTYPASVVAGDFIIT
jgi:hypothetical protein